MRIVVGMSGGVDSSVAALLLKQAGHDVIGVFMRNWPEQADDGYCTATDDWHDVRQVCDQIGIPYYAVDFSTEYNERVFQLFLDEYRAGRTPNPDVWCNREIKFDSFLRFAKELGAEKIATGHFVRTNAEGHLLKGLDPNKDQSYFLYLVKRAQLMQTVFPVGGMTKSQVRDMATQNGLPVSKKKDSTGICFIGERPFREFLKTYLPATPGEIRTLDGRLVGEHEGLMYYTLGQRKGMGIGGQHEDGRPFFVVGKDLDNNVLLVDQGDDSPALYTDVVDIEQISWTDEAVGAEGAELPILAKCRYRQPDQEAVLVYHGDKGQVHFKNSQRAVTPGQSLVIYRADRCFGGGIITAATKC